MRLASLALLLLALVAVPGTAQTVYSNGPTNGNLNAWAVNFGFIVSDTFTLNALLNSTVVTGASFGMWLFPGDNLLSAELSITSNENGGTSCFDQILNFTQGSCSANNLGFNVCTETTFFNGPTLSNGTYWLNLQNAVTTFGIPVYWDENAGGPSSHAWPQSLASQNTMGTIPSESFTVLGIQPIAPNSTTTTGTVPEPSSIMLFGSGILGLAGVLRRKLF